MFPALLCGGLCLSDGVAAEASKTYTLFEGDNIEVGEGDNVYPVRDVSGGSWVIVVDGKEVLLSAKSGPIAMKVTPFPKLSETSVTLANLKTERTYTFKNDPTVRLTRSMSQTAVTTAGFQAAASQAAAAQSTSNLVSSSNDPTHPTSGTATMSAGDRASQAISSGPGASLVRIGPNDTEGDFDALDVSFEISSPTPLRTPYIVAMTRIHEPGAPAGSFRNVVFAKALEPVSAKPSKVKYQQAGLPFGYLLEDYEIHVYDSGREVATNLSPKRQVFTFDQAFGYVRSKYIEAHQTGTFPAVPVMGDLPPDFASQVATGKYSAPLYIKVSPEGLAREAFTDLGCKTRIEDPFVDSVVRSIRFKPALEAGKPVDGVVTLNLSKLRM